MQVIANLEPYHTRRLMVLLSAILCKYKVQMATSFEIITEPPYPFIGSKSPFCTHIKSNIHYVQNLLRLYSLLHKEVKDMVNSVCS